MVSSVLIVEAHPLLQDAMRGLLAELAPSAQVQASATMHEALRLLTTQSETPDLILLDLHLPDLSHLAALAALRDIRPTACIVVLSDDLRPATVFRCLELQAWGYLPRTMPREEMLEALRTVLEGNIFVPKQAFFDSQDHPADQRLVRDEHQERGIPRLTPRELDVLQLMRRGYPNKLIGRELGMAAGTVRGHISAILRALQVSNRTQAVIAAGALPAAVASSRTPYTGTFLPQRAAGGETPRLHFDAAVHRRQRGKDLRPNGVDA
jgi:DNA-binding NarL/FixJ family response regulator